MSGDKIFLSTSVHQELGEWVDLRVGYSLFDIDNPSHRLGLGLSLNLGPLQIFGSVNDVLGIVNYGTARGTSGMIGVNINIGTRKDRDYDEVPDKRDSCFKTYGVLSNNGCPYGFLGVSMNYNKTEEEVIQETEQGLKENLTEPSISNVEESEPLEPLKIAQPEAPESTPIVKPEPVDSDSNSVVVAETAASAPMASDSLKTFTDVEIQALKDTGVLFDSAAVDLSTHSIIDKPKENSKKELKEASKPENSSVKKEKSKAIKSKDLEDLISR